MPHPPPLSRHKRLAVAGRTLIAAAVFAGGLLAAGAFSPAVPAAPQQCLPVVGCVTTTIPSVPLPTVSVPSVPTLPTSSTTTTTSSGSGSSGATTTPPQTTPVAGTVASPKAAAALSAKASVRVRGRGAGRVIEVRLRLTKPALVSALLSRSSRALARRQFAAREGSTLVRLRIGRAVRSGPARLALVYTAASGETVRASYRLRLPR
jgi:hypothetical protein